MDKRKIILKIGIVSISVIILAVSIPLALIDFMFNRALSKLAD